MKGGNEYRRKRRLEGREKGHEGRFEWERGRKRRAEERKVCI